MWKENEINIPGSEYSLHAAQYATRIAKNEKAQSHTVIIRLFHFKPPFFTHLSASPLSRMP